MIIFKGIYLKALTIEKLLHSLILILGHIVHTFIGDNCLFFYTQTLK